MKRIEARHCNPLDSVRRRGGTRSADYSGHSIRIAIIWILFTICLLGGCKAAGPVAMTALAPPPGAWSADLRAGVHTTTNAKMQSLDQWWTVLNDPVLTGLVARAQTGNLDVRQAMARLRSARAEREINRAERLPTVTANGSVSRARSSGQTGSAMTSERYANSLDATWELDLFGGKRRAFEAAEATWQASREDLRDVLVSLCAEVALAYVDMRVYQKRLSIAESNLVSQSETYDLARWRQQAQLVTQLDVDQARLSLEQTRASIPSFRSSLEQSMHRLATLLGLPPGALRTLLNERYAVPNPPLEVAVGVPADVLRQRPDVRRAERQFAAQAAKVGVAEAAQYPNLTLSGSIGLEALAAGDLYTCAARTISGAASAGWTLLDGGKKAQAVVSQVALRDEALSAYEAAILKALQDVEDALVAYGNEHDRRRALADAEQSARSAAALARDRYASGLIDFETVLSTQQALLAVQDSLASSQAETSADLIRLYKALGGGWSQQFPDVSEAAK